MGTAFLTWILCQVFTFNMISLANSELCERYPIQNGVLDEKDEGLRAEDGIYYPNGTFWKDKQDTWWTCPCTSGTCLRICNIDKHLKLLETEINVTNIYLLLQDVENLTANIWEHDDTIIESIILNRSFRMVLLNETEECRQGYQPELHIYSTLMKNGALLHVGQDETYDVIQQDPENFCIFPIEFGNGSVTIVCLQSHGENNSTLRWVYITIFAISIFFLILTLTAHLLVLPIFKGLHEKIMVSQCCCFILALFCQLLLVSCGDIVGDGLCYFLAFANHYCNLSSFFWLNVMCFEIYSTFHANWQQHNLKFRHLALYAWGCPLVVSMIAISTQIFLPVEHPFHPGVGIKYCGFKGTTELLYYQGPALILFLINMTMFILTALNVRKVRKESRATLRGEPSEAHKSNSRINCKKMRLAMYLKLFLLMGCTWILEFVSFLFPDLENLWVYTDAINYSRGVLIFWITVGSNQKMYKALKSKLHNESSNAETDISAL